MADYLPMLKDYIMQNIETVLLVIVALLVVTALSFILLNIKLTKVLKRYRDLTRGMDNVNMEELLGEYMSTLKDVLHREEELTQRVLHLEEEDKKVIKKIGHLRYDAFEGSGGELSFSLALLNSEDSGVVVTSLYGREENRVYLKPIVQGASNFHLSPEELKVLESAKMGQRNSL